MIYSFTFDGSTEERGASWESHGREKGFSPMDAMEWKLETSNDFFVCIITKQQWPKWEAASTKLKEYIHYKMPYFVSNPRYPTEGRKLCLIILKGKGSK